MEEQQNNEIQMLNVISRIKTLPLLKESRCGSGADGSKIKETLLFLVKFNREPRTGNLSQRRVYNKSSL